MFDYKISVVSVFDSLKWGNVDCSSSERDVVFYRVHYLFDKMLLRFKLCSFHLLGFVCFSSQGDDQEALKKLVSRSHESKVTVMPIGSSLGLD